MQSFGSKDFSKVVKKIHGEYFKFDDDYAFLFTYI